MLRHLTTLTSYIPLVAFTLGHLNELRSYPAQIDRLSIGELVHCCKRNVEGALRRMIDGKDVDALALVRELPAGAALIRPPATDDEASADVGEPGQLAKDGEACVQIDRSVSPDSRVLCEQRGPHPCPLRRRGRWSMQLRSGSTWDCRIARSKLPQRCQAWRRRRRRRRG